MREYKILIIDNSQNIAIIEKYVQGYFQKNIYIDKTHTIKEGLKYLSKNKPDIIIMDTIVDFQDGFKFLDVIIDLNIQIILTSTEKSFALKAVKYQVSYFVLKPIEKDKLFNALKRTICKIENKKDIKPDISSLLPSKQKLAYMAIPTGSKIILLNTEELLYCEAIGRNTLFYMIDGVKHKSNKNIGIYEALLKNNKFFRIHKKYLVNFNQVQKINKVGGHTCELLYGVSLPISTRKNIQLRKYLNIN